MRLGRYNRHADNSLIFFYKTTSKFLGFLSWTAFQGSCKKYRERHRKTDGAPHSHPCCSSKLANLNATLRIRKCHWQNYRQTLCFALTVILVPSRNTVFFPWPLKHIKRLSMKLKLTEPMSVFQEWSYLEEQNSASTQVARISYSYTIH